jgi:hypothetical protein
MGYVVSHILSAGSGTGWIEEAELLKMQKSGRGKCCLL